MEKSSEFLMASSSPREFRHTRCPIIQAHPSLGFHNQAHPLPPNQSYNQSSNYQPPQYQYQSASPHPLKNFAFEEKVLIALGNLGANTQII